MKYIILFFLLVSCNTTKGSKDLEKEVLQLNQKVAYLQYEMENKSCFTKQDICLLKNTNKKECRQRHIKCIIINHKIWIKVKERYGIK